MRLSDRLTMLRRQFGYTLDEVSEKTGIRRDLLVAFESGKFIPELGELKKLSTLYSISVDEILERNKPFSFNVNDEDEDDDDDDFDIKEDDDEDIKEDDKYKHHQRKNALFAVPYPLLITIVYLILGFGYDKWHPWWVLFLTIPVFYSIAQAFEKKDLKHFNYPCVVVITYLLIGIFGHLWHPGWLLFITIPIYYSIVLAIKKKRIALLNIPCIAVIVFFLIGFYMNNGFSYSWIVFVAIPVFYSIATNFDRRRLETSEY